MAEPIIGCRPIGWVASMSTFFVRTSPTQDKAGLRLGIGIAYTFGERGEKEAAEAKAERG